MKKIVEFFRSLRSVQNKDEKITDKVFTQNLIVSVVSIVLCLVALCSMTYCWFSTESSSDNNTLTSGRFHFTVTLLDNSAAEVTATAVDSTRGTATYTLDSGTYTVVLDPGDDVTSKGYCIIKAGAEELETDVIVGASTVNSENYQVHDPFTFTLTVAADGTVVEFAQHWGVSAEDDTVGFEETAEV